MIPIATLRLGDVMDRHVFAVTPNSTLGDMVERMRREHVTHVVVVDVNKPIGMLTDRDLVRLLHRRVDRSRQVSEFMSVPVSTVSNTLGFRTAYIQLCLSRLRHLIVVDANGLVTGVASEKDFLGHLGMELFQNIRTLRDLIDRTTPQLSLSTPVVEAIDLMVRERRGCVLVAEDGRLKGIFTEQQSPTVLARHEDGSPTKIGEAMRAGILPVAESASVAEVMGQMVSDRIGHVVVTDADGAIIGTIAQSRLLENVRTAVYAEMATRQLVEDQLHQVEAQLSATLEQTPNVAVQWYDRDGRVRYWNRASELLYGYSAIQAMGKSLDQLILTSAETNQFVALLADVERTGKTVGPTEYETRNRLGAMLWIESTIFPIPGEAEGESYFVCMDIDITRRKQLDMQMRKLAQAVEQSPESIVITNLAAEIEFVNDAFVRATGYSRDEVIGRNPRVLHSGKTTKATFDSLWESLTHGKVWHGELRNKRKDGSEYIEQATIGPIRQANGQVTHYVAVKLDITQRKEAEENATRVTQLLTEAIESIEQGFTIYDEQDRLLVCNETYKEIYATSRDLIVPGATFEEIVRKGAERGQYKAAEGRVDAWVKERVERHQSADGSYLEQSLDDGRWLLIVEHRTPSGYIVGNRIDITARKTLENRLAEFNRDFEAFLDQTTDLIYFKDINSRFRFCSQTLADITHHKHWRDMIGKHDSEVFPADTAKIYYEEELPIFTEGKPLLGKVNPYYDTQGNTGYVLTNKWPLFDPSGKVAGIFGISRDITEQKRTELELHRHRKHLEELVAERTAQLTEQRSQMETILRNIPGVVGYWDREQRNRFANPGYMDWIGRSGEEIHGKHLEEVFGSDRYHNIIQPRADAALKGERQLFEQTFPSLDRPGHFRHAEVHYVPDRRGDEIAGFFVLAFDITALKEAKDAAEAAAVAKSAFLANMSHEIRTPLNAITGMAHLIRREGLSSNQSDRLGKLEAASGHLLEIINAVLELSKIEAGKFVLEDAEVDVALLLEDVVHLVEVDARRKGLALSTYVIGSPGPLRGDATRLRQALLNYAINAIKFTDRGTVTLGVEVIDADQGNVTLRFEVRDTGIGIGGDTLQRLFNAFEQADNSSTRHYGGTGLGLAITKKLAQMMGGDAGATSILGVGSVFWFTTHLSRGGQGTRVADTTRVDAEMQLRSEFAGRRILLVEDEPVNREVMMILLADAKLQVDVAEDGGQAVAMAQAASYDLVLMDVQMPILDGLAAAQQIRGMMAYRATPILAVTANAFDEDRAACLAAGMDDFVAKPVIPALLFATISKWLGHGRTQASVGD